jgi:hypothetical protein
MTGVPEMFAAPTPDQILDQLERLGMLREQGVLTAEEFATQKWKILGF